MSSAAQILRQAESLKASLVENGRSVAEGGKGALEGSKAASEGGKGGSDVWVTRQKLEDVYKRLLLMDLEYALDKKVEQDLWNHAFKNQITVLQTQAKDKHNPKKLEVQANLNLFLETASGFYLQFLQLICSTFKLDLPFRRKSSAFGVMKEKTQLRAKITPPKKSSCLYICQYCLVHLGDIARYRQQGEQAQTYYRHAVNLSPQNGQPYNQLAILEVNRNNKLSSVFYYVRSLAVRHPFPVAATNLEKFYAKLIKDTSEFKGKMTQNEFVNAFLQFQALLHLAADLGRASYVCGRILSCLPAHLMSGTFSASVLVQCVAITIFTLNHARHVPSGGDISATTSPKGDNSSNMGGGGGEQDVGGGGDKWNSSSPSSFHQLDVMLSDEEQKTLDIILGFTASVLELLIQHTPQVPTKARESPTLPAVQVLLDWLRHSPDIITLPPFANSNIWSYLADLLNTVQQFEDGKPQPDLSKYDEVPLPEDTELRCFQPIEKAHSKYSFSRIPVDGFPRGIEELVRCMRLVNQGKAITEECPQLKMTAVQQNDPPHINFSGPLVMKSTEPLSTSHERRAKQNVAMQAIMKHGQGVQSDAGRGKSDNVSSATTDTTEQDSSPKYLLGTVTSEPQFMKHGMAAGGGSGAAVAGASTGRLQTSPQLSPGFSRRGQSPQARAAASSPMQQGFTTTSPRVISPRPSGGRVASPLQPLQQQSPPPQAQARKQQQQQQQVMSKASQLKQQEHPGPQPQPMLAQHQQQQQVLAQQQQQQIASQQQQQQQIASQQQQQQQQQAMLAQNPHSGKVRFQASSVSPPTPGRGQHAYPPGSAPFQDQGQVQGHPQGHGPMHMPQGHGFQGQNVQTMQGHSSGVGAQPANTGASQYPPFPVPFPGAGGERFHMAPQNSVSSSPASSSSARPPADASRMQQQQQQPSFVAAQSGVNTSPKASQNIVAPAPGVRHPSPNMPLNREMLSALRLASQISQQGQGVEGGMHHHPHAHPHAHPHSQQDQSVHVMARGPIQRPPINPGPAPRGGGVGGAPSSLGPAARVGGVNAGGGGGSIGGMGPSNPAGGVGGCYPPPRSFHPVAAGMGLRPNSAGDVPMHAFSGSARPPQPQGQPPRPNPPPQVTARGPRIPGSMVPHGHEMGMVPSSRLPAPPIPMPTHHSQGAAGFPPMMAALFQEDGGGGARSDGVRGYQALSPLTIQPPKSSPPDTRISTSFQGHAEGTPKPDKQEGMTPVKREVEPVIHRVAMPVGQPGGEYSLFASSSPWSMPLNSNNDSKSMTSSPFSSQDSSMRNSPVVGFDPQAAGPYDSSARNKALQAEGWVALGQSYEEQKGGGQGQANMPPMWTEAAPMTMTPLERLLEQQRMQRQTDPH